MSEPEAKKLNGALIGVGKMGISHLAILGASPLAKITAICDPTSYVLSVMRKYTGVRTYRDYAKLFSSEHLDFVVVATPTSSHFDIAMAALEHGAAVFMEKPLCLDPAQSLRLCELAKAKGKANQVGYHNRSLATFREVRRLVAAKALGTIYHVSGTAFGPVVVRRKQGSTWRAKKSEGGGCLHDYACHVVDLMNFVVGPPAEVVSASLASIFSSGVEDVVQASFRYPGGSSGRLEANWSDPSTRKMSTTITVWGDRGHIVADRQECRVFLHDDASFESYGEGWTTRYITDLQEPVDFYLRGEEYSAQLDSFLRSVAAGTTTGDSSFATAHETDKVIWDISRMSQRAG